MSTRDDVNRRFEENLQALIRIAAIKVSALATKRMPWAGPQADWDRWVIETTIRHLVVEQALLAVPEEIDHLLDTQREAT